MIIGHGDAQYFGASKVKKRQLASLLAAWFLTAAPVCGDPLIIYTENYPPYSYLGESGVVEGLATVKVRQVMDASGIDYEIRLVPWTRAVQYATTQNNSLIFSITRTPGREAKYDWLVPLADSNFYMFVRADEMRPVTEAALKAGKFTGSCVSNDLGCELFSWTGMPPENVIPVSSTETADFRMVIAGRADIYISDLSVNNRLRISHGFDPNLTKPVMRLTGKTGFYLASGKYVPDAIRAKIKLTYDQLTADGLYRIVDLSLEVE